MNNHTQKTTLYRYFDSAGKLLYVGITKNQFDRLQAHSRNASWFHEIYTARFEHYETRQLALRAETKAIATELPKFNKAGPLIPPKHLEHLLALVYKQLPDSWHTQRAARIENVMRDINLFSMQNELTKLGFAFSSSFDWIDDGETRVVECNLCAELVESKWFKYIEDESQSIIDEYNGENL